MYPACNAQSPYCHVWLVRLYNIFPHCLKIFEKELSNIKCVTTFSLQLLPETLIIIEELVINVHRSSCNGPVKLSDFNESWIFSTDFLKSLKYQIFWKSVQWKPSCSMWIDWQSDIPKLKLCFRNLPTRLKMHAEFHVVYRSVTCGVLRAVQCSSPEFRKIWKEPATLIRLQS
jgi:hypothetical protein